MHSFYATVYNIFYAYLIVSKGFFFNESALCLDFSQIVITDYRDQTLVIAINWQINRQISTEMMFLLSRTNWANKSIDLTRFGRICLTTFKQDYGDIIRHFLR